MSCGEILPSVSEHAILEFLYSQDWSRQDHSILTDLSPTGDEVFIAGREKAAPPTPIFSGAELQHSDTCGLKGLPSLSQLRGSSVVVGER